MSLKKIFETEVIGGQQYRVYRDSVWNEFKIRFYENGKLMPSHDDFTPNKEDALETAKYLISLVKADSAETDLQLLDLTDLEVNELDTLMKFSVAATKNNHRVFRVGLDENIIYVSAISIGEALSYLDREVGHPCSNWEESELIEVVL